MNYYNMFNKSVNWIKANTVENKGIIIATSNKLPYPEVTGYYIPSLIKWGFNDIAVSYAKWLLSIQKADGSWFDAEDKDPYVFDTAQILKGLIAVRQIYPGIDDAIIKGCDWILQNIKPDGRLTTPSKVAWGKNDKFCSEMIHLYCLSPLAEATRISGNTVYEKAVEKVSAYYKNNHMDRITDFNMLSHFYAYVMEGLLDIGETDLVRNAMKKMEKYQRKNGMVPAFHDAKWTCSTGCFQLALVWYRLGDIEVADKTFEYACSLQNSTGGWYGSYATNKLQPYLPGKYHPGYFAKSEISWAVKYFLDALYCKCSFNPKCAAMDTLKEISAN